MLTINKLETARDFLSFPDMDDAAWQLEKLHEMLEIKVGRPPEPISDRTIWSEANGIDLMAVARDIVREAMLADPKIQRLSIDFLDCEGSPFIWLQLPDEGESADDVDATSFSDYLQAAPPEGFPCEDLERIAQDLLGEFYRESEIVFERPEIMGGANE